MELEALAIAFGVVMFVLGWRCGYERGHATD